MSVGVLLLNDSTSIVTVVVGKSAPPKPAAEEVVAEWWLSPAWWRKEGLEDRRSGRREERECENFRVDNICIYILSYLYLCGAPYPGPSPILCSILLKITKKK